MTECTHCRKRYENEVRFCPVDGFAVVPVTEHREPWVGRLLMGQFQIQAVCGQGATGTVYRASQAGMERQVAVKVLRADLLKDPDIVKRFVREARAGAKLSHANIATVHMVGQTEDGVPFIVMEYIDGRPLSALLDKGRRLPLGKIVDLASQIASALTEAHAQGIVHRDLKPENILVSERRGQADVVKLVDFGIAKILVAYAPGEDAISRMGTVFGTPHYIAPEQASGQAVDGRADLYSLGCIVYQMATGRVPFDGQAGLQVLLSQVRDPVTDPRDVNPKLSDGLASLILGLLEKNPAQRPQTAKEVREELLSLVPAPGSNQPAPRDAADDEDAAAEAGEEDLDREEAADEGPSLDAWASGAHEETVPAERPRTPPVSARRPASGAAVPPKSGRRAEPTPRPAPRSGRPSSGTRPRPVAAERPEPIEEVRPRRRRELIEEDDDGFAEPFYKRHAKPLLGVFGAISFGLLFGVLYAQLKTPPAPAPMPVVPPTPASGLPPPQPTMRSGPRPSAPAVRPSVPGVPSKPAGGSPPAAPVSAGAPLIPAATGLPSTGSLPLTPPTLAPTPAAAPPPAPAAPTAALPDKPAEKIAEKSAEKNPEKSAEKATDKPTDKPTDKSTDKSTDKPVDKPADKAPEKQAEKNADKPTEKPADKPPEKPADKPKDSAPEESPSESGTDPYNGLK